MNIFSLIRFHRMYLLLFVIKFPTHFNYKINIYLQIGLMKNKHNIISLFINYKQK